MAELGVVASGIAVASLAARLAEGAVKLKAFTDSVKNAPDEIKGIVSGVETLTLVLSDISSRAEIHADEIGLQSTRSCLSHCQIAVEALTKVAQDLSEGIRRRRRLGSLKAVLRNGEILSLRQRLIDAQMSLVLSRQIYTEALLEHQQQLRQHWEMDQQLQFRQIQVEISHSREVTLAFHSQYSTLASQKSLTDDHDPFPVTKLPTYNRINQTHKTTSLVQHKAFVKQLKAPVWFPITSTSLEIIAQRVLLGWQFSFRSFKRHSWDSPIRHYLIHGNISAIQDMMSQRQLLPNDLIGDTNSSILTIAAIFQQNTLCKFLLDNGARVDSSALRRAIEGGGMAKSTSANIELIDLLDKSSEEFDLFETVDYEFDGDPEVLSWMIRRSKIEGYDQSLDQCRKCLMAVCSLWEQAKLATKIRLILDGRGIDSDICHLNNCDEMTLLHFNACSLGALYFQSPNSFSYFKNISQQNVTEDIRDLIDLLVVIRDLVLAGSGLHRLGFHWWLMGNICQSEARTPFLAVIQGFFSPPWVEGLYVWENAPLASEIKALMFVWLELLQDCGVGLEDYGQEEKEVTMRDDISRKFRYRYRSRNATGYKTHRVSLIFTYGPEPSDWTFWLIHVMRNDFREFWWMVENPERFIPGSWACGNEEWDDSDTGWDDSDSE